MHYTVSPFKKATGENTALQVPIPGRMIHPSPWSPRPHSFYEALHPDRSEDEGLY